MAEEPTVKPAYATVALADDFILLREGLAAICELSGIYHVTTQCADGQVALNALLETDPDIAVVDFKLPGLAALELLSDLRRLGRRTRVVVMADRRDRKIAVEVLRAGGRGVLLESDTSREVLLAFEQVAVGASNGQIAVGLSLRVATVKRHTANIREKLGVHSRVHAGALLHAFASTSA